MSANEVKTREPESKLYGTIERITYFNEERNYCVARAKCDGEKELITIVGTFASINVGEFVEMSGTWQSHKEYGRQFKVSEYVVKLPNTITGIKKYLGSGLIRGIGPKMAERITNHFKAATIEVIEKTPRALLEIDGIGEWRLEQIAESWKTQSAIRGIMIFLQKYNISTSIATKIYRHYGENSISALTENPYRLADDIYGIGFKSADRIALSMNIAEDSEVRARACVSYCLGQQVLEGHIFTFKTKLFEELKQFIDIQPHRFEGVIEKMAAAEDIVVENGDQIYLNSLYISESRAAKNLVKIFKTPFKKLIFEVDAIIARIESTSKIKYSPLQLEAINTALISKAMVLTGGPGTGKTTTIRGIIRAFKMLGLKVLQCAPTGRAAKKMEESTGETSKTIHRLLEFSPGGKGFLKGPNEPLDCDVLICDEVSMIDIVLMHHLLKAVPPHAKIVLIGDINQLPSVGPGSVLKDVIGSKVIPTISLDRIFRQDEKSLIITNAHRINNGEMPYFPDKSAGELADFYFIEKEDQASTAAAIIKMVTERIPDKFGLKPIDDVQVLCPMYRGECGVTSLNGVLQGALNPSKLELFHKTRIFKLGDKVIQNENDYKKNVFNGDIGKISDVRTQDRSLVIDFPQGQIEYEYNDLDSLELAYAITIHKSQGSEYPAVVIPVLTSHFIMLQRNLLYTAVTRAKMLVILIGTKKAVHIALSNNKVLERNSNLLKRICAEVN
ncbi:MAG: ATP-dependent RecD-like DNA helicase [bacterium ADurb.Bin243]|nr:MAG: ATP-dependent RecD-like DNA helicase [bacterium ADurb.Bin243]